MSTRFRLRVTVGRGTQSPTGSGCGPWTRESAKAANAAAPGPNISFPRLGGGALGGFFGGKGGAPGVSAPSRGGNAGGGFGADGSSAGGGGHSGGGGGAQPPHFGGQSARTGGSANAGGPGKPGGGGGGAPRKQCGCFEAGTEILTLEHGIISIEDVDVGMRVAAIDEATGEQDWKPVTDLINYGDHATYDVVVRIETADGAISTEQLGVTEEHPFRVFRDGDFEWVSADALSAGDVLSSVTLGTNKALTVSEASVSVQSVSLSGDVEPVYNFTVAEFHTYHVGELGIWVHNDNCTELHVASPALKNDPYHPDVVAARVKPELKPNPAHDRQSPLFNPRKTPEPSDSLEVYQRAERVGLGKWVGKSESGQYCQFFSDNAGGVHFAGTLTNSALVRYGIRP